MSSSRTHSKQGGPEPSILTALSPSAELVAYGKRDLLTQTHTRQGQHPICFCGCCKGVPLSSVVISQHWLDLIYFSVFLRYVHGQTFVGVWEAVGSNGCGRRTVGLKVAKGRQGYQEAQFQRLRNSIGRSRILR